LDDRPRSAVKDRPVAALAPTDSFVPRHIGPDDAEIAQMLDRLGVPSLDALIEQTVPGDIRLRRPLELPTARG